jgi:hypothetical protein
VDPVLDRVAVRQLLCLQDLDPEQFLHFFTTDGFGRLRAGSKKNTFNLRHGFGIPYAVFGWKKKKYEGRSAPYL